MTARGDNAPAAPLAGDLAGRVPFRSGLVFIQHCSVSRRLTLTLLPDDTR